ncbi:MAG: NAD(P)/FAD-dependent oxidoreductase [Halanaeroarchaeum sp.]
MTDSVVVLGGGYAGTAALTRFQDHAIDDCSVTWIDDTAYHLVRHEVHRVVRDPTVRPHITVPLADVADGDTSVVRGTVEAVHPTERRVQLEEGDSIPFDYLVVAIGSEPAFYGIEGLRSNAYPLSTLQDAVGIHDAVADAAAKATPSSPAQIVVGGGGLSGIQTAGEIAAYRDEHDAPIAITLVEALRRILPEGDDDLRAAIETTLRNAGVDVRTNTPIVEATPDRVFFDDREPIPTDVLVWTGGISGRATMGASGLETDSNRLRTGSDFQTSDERIFAVGDSALVETGGGTVPPTAQAAIQSGKAVADNVVRKRDGRPLERWRYRDRGTLVSVGDTALAADVIGLPAGVVDGHIATVMKKGVATRWLASITSWERALRAWPAL